jgi:hypothetical protein
MASNSQNTFSKLLGVQANGTPMGIGASDLASVLGGQSSLINALTNNGIFKYYQRLDGANNDLDNIKDSGLYGVATNVTHSPEPYCGLMVLKVSYTEVYQFAFSLLTGHLFVRGFGAEWSSWFMFTGTAVE